MTIVDMSNADLMGKILDAAELIAGGVDRINGDGWKVYDTKTPSKEGNKVIRIDLEVQAVA